MTNSIKIENLSKRYQLGLTHAGSVRELANRCVQRLRGQSTNPAPVVEDSARVQDGKFWALRDIDLEISQGEVVGIIGKNGAGKSTLLKLLSRITYPTSGRIELNGRVASLLEVGTGFHPELTGRENVYLNGTILGMTRSEIRRQLDDIVEFSGVGKFLDTPVKRYSSGMTVRLGFAVAAHLDPEILIVDEVLAVGDVEFQNRCIGKMQSVADSGKTVLFVSHNLGSIRSLTTRAVVLSEGRVIFDGPTQEGVQRYVQENMITADSTVSIADAPRAFHGLDQKLRFTDLRILNTDEFGNLPTSGEFKLSATVESSESTRHLQIAMTIMTDDKTPVGSIISNLLPAPSIGSSETYQLQSQFRLAPGKYHCAISITDARSALRHMHDSLSDVMPFSVAAAALDGSGAKIEWHPGWGQVRFPDLDRCTA